MPQPLNTSGHIPSSFSQRNILNCSFSPSTLGLCVCLTFLWTHLMWWDQTLTSSSLSSFYMLKCLHLAEGAYGVYSVPLCCLLLSNAGTSCTVCVCVQEVVCIISIWLLQCPTSKRNQNVICNYTPVCQVPCRHQSWVPFDKSQVHGWVPEGTVSYSDLSDNMEKVISWFNFSTTLICQKQ